MRLLSDKKVFGLLVIVIAAAAFLILINFFTLKITSAMRAYIHGESQYSKGQKDAHFDMIMYLDTGDTVYWNLFHKNLSIPVGDSIARSELMKGGPEEVVKRGFLQGNNKEEDLDGMIWLFRNFRKASFMNEAIVIWTNADVLIREAGAIGDSVHNKLQRGAIASDERLKITERINANEDKLTQYGVAFSNSLLVTARILSDRLFYANLVMTLLIVSSASAYAFFMIKRLRQTNQELHTMNQELDGFVYSVSHDLRAPISSLKGLIAITQNENNPGVLKANFGMMLNSLKRQDEFIQEIIDFSRNKKMTVRSELVNIEHIIDVSIAHHQHMPGAQGILIEKDLESKNIESDPVRIEIIVNNILSNAIKYSDNHKEKKKVTIRSFRNADHFVLEFADNGIGISAESVNRIFEMFYVTEHAMKGSGLGLHIVKETLQKLNGTVRVESEIGVGTKFTIVLPC